MPLHRHLPLPVSIVGIGLGLCFGLAVHAQAASANISQSYRSTAGVVGGSLVALESTKDNRVQLANLSNGDRLIGLAVGANDSLVSIDSTSETVQVATSGIANALVSDVNGMVKSGDQISVSPFSGVGMKAEPGLRLVGLAQSALSGSGSGVTKKQLKNKDGKEQTVSVGYVRVSILVGSSAKAPEATNMNSLQRLATRLVGHPVSNARIVLGSLIAIIALVALVTLIYTSVYGTIVAIGRNPLARASIFRALGAVVGLAFATGLVAVATIYLIIR